MAWTYLKYTPSSYKLLQFRQGHYSKWMHDVNINGSFSNGKSEYILADIHFFTFICHTSVILFLFQSLRSRGVRFPGRDHESLAPIFTPPRTVSASEPSVTLAQQIQHEIPRENFTAENTKEVFDVARNSIELLTTVLSSSPQQDALQVLLFYSYYHISMSRSEVIVLIHPQGIGVGLSGSRIDDTSD